MKTLLFAFACIALTTSCKKKDDAGGGAKTGDKKPDDMKKPDDKAPAAAGAATCAPDATKDAEAGYCIKVPAAWKVFPKTDPKYFKRDYGPSEYETRVTVIANIGGQKLADALVFVKGLSKPTDPKAKGMPSGDLPGGGGFGGVDYGSGISQGGIVMQGPKGVLECSFNVKTENYAESFEACKTIAGI